MQVFLPPHVFKIANNIVTALDSIGVTYTSSINDKVDAVIYRDETESEIVSYYNEDNNIVIDFAGDLAQYVAYRNNLPKRTLTWKSTLNDELIKCNLPVIDTIYPTSDQEIQDFFIKHSDVGVYCKSVLSKSGAPNPSLLTDNENTDLIFPDNVTFYNQRYLNYSAFLKKIGGDIDKFLTIQNSNRSLAVHKCVLQRDHGTNVDTFWLSGCVNANNEFYFYPTVNTTVEYLRNTTNNLQLNMHGYYTDEQLNDTIRDPNNFNVDTIGIFDDIKKLFASANVSSTFFSVQGIFDSQGNKLMRDISLNPVSSHIFANPPEVLADHLKFVLGLQPEVTMKHDKYVMYMPFSLNTTTYSKQLLQNITSSCNVIPIHVVENGQNGNFCFIGDSKEEVVSNMKMVYNTFIKPNSI